MLSNNFFAFTLVALMGLICINAGFLPNGGEASSDLDVKSATNDSQCGTSDAIEDLPEEIFEDVGYDENVPNDPAMVTTKLYDYGKFIDFAQLSTARNATPEIKEWADLGAAIFNLYPPSEHGFSEDDFAKGSNADKFYAFAFLSGLDVNAYAEAMNEALGVWVENGSKGPVPTVDEIVKMAGNISI